MFRNIIIRTHRNVSKGKILAGSFRYHVTATSGVKDKWHLYAGLCLERKPVITKTLNELEIKFKNMLELVELENSMKCDHEMKAETENRRNEMLKGQISLEALDLALGESAGEFEDKSRNELKEFQPASRITEADEKNDVQSVERCLDKHLLFITEEKVGDSLMWLLPHGRINEGETLRQTAERILIEKCGDKVKVRNYGNAPCGFYKYKYPVELRNENNAIGAKIFYYKLRYLGGEIKSSNFCWARRDELPEQLNEKYYKSIKLFLIDDEP